jgi:myosin-1
MLKCLKLQRNLDNYSILSGSHFQKGEEIDDKTNFLATKRAMEIIGFDPEEILSVFQIVSAVLKLGNLQFIPRANIDGTEGCSLLNEYEILDVCELLLTDMPSLEAAFTQRIIETRHEFLVADLSSVEAKTTRDALCKALYSRLFTWIVTKLNECIKAKTLSKRKSVGILDVYGFEVFETNFFEQFLINYCNEKLHQIFIDMTLKYEQEEYIKEGIQWKKIDFFNNSSICELIEKFK